MSEIMEENEMLAYLREAYSYAQLSNDKSTQNGAVLVEFGEDSIVAGGCNSIAQCSQHVASRFERPEKYLWTEHAERAAILNAAKSGVATNNLWMFCAWAACPDCARAIALSGISKLVRHWIPQHDNRGDQWEGLVRIGDQILDESGVEVLTIGGKIGTTILFDGKVIEV